MSRTDVHRPWRVQLADPYNRHLLYRYGTFPDAGGEPLITSWRNLGCGCQLCTGRRGRKIGRRQQRAALRTALRDARKTVVADRDTIDVPPPRRIDAW
jgi:hypothetical protein